MHSFHSGILVTLLLFCAHTMQSYTSEKTQSLPELSDWPSLQRNNTRLLFIKSSNLQSYEEKLTSKGSKFTHKRKSYLFQGKTYSINLEPDEENKPIHQKPTSKGSKSTPKRKSYLFQGNSYSINLEPDEENKPIHQKSNLFQRMRKFKLNRIKKKKEVDELLEVNKKHKMRKHNIKHDENPHNSPHIHKHSPSEAQSTHKATEKRKASQTSERTPVKRMALIPPPLSTQSKWESAHSALPPPPPPPPQMTNEPESIPHSHQSPLIKISPEDFLKKSQRLRKSSIEKQSRPQTPSFAAHPPPPPLPPALMSYTAAPSPPPPLMPSTAAQFDKPAFKISGEDFLNGAKRLKKVKTRESPPLQSTQPLNKRTITVQDENKDLANPSPAPRFGGFNMQEQLKKLKKVKPRDEQQPQKMNQGGQALFPTPPASPFEVSLQKIPLPVPPKPKFAFDSIHSGNETDENTPPPSPAGSLSSQKENSLEKVASSGAQKRRQSGSLSDELQQILKKRRISLTDQDSDQ